MRRALSYIADEQRAFSALPFFSYLRDRRMTAQERFSFTPAVAPFVMAFADLNKYILHVPEPTSPLEEIVNAHSQEDATHFQMYLADLKTLEFDVPWKFADTLRFLWADDRQHCRRTCYTLTALLASAPLTLRVVVVEAIESAGAAAFETLTELAAEYCAATGKELQFFGQRHKDLETGHALGTDDIEGRLRALVLSDLELRQAELLIDEVFHTFSVMMHELHEYGLQRTHGLLRSHGLSPA
jgi:hypothetical protein